MENLNASKNMMKFTLIISRLMNIFYEGLKDNFNINLIKNIWRKFYTEYENID